MKSMYDCYRLHRDEGCAPRAATELVAKLYGKEDRDEIAVLQRTLERIEQRDRPPDPGVPPVNAPAGIAEFYLSERRAGRTHEQARELVAHAYGHRGEALEQQLAGPRRRFEAEQVVTRPQTPPQSLTAGAKA